jgi:hypothetical protein
MRAVSLWTTLLLFPLTTACHSHTQAAAPAAPAVGDVRTVVFSGMCDASGAVPVGPRLFAVADDEDNVLRVYDAEAGGAPLQAVDVSSDLPLGKPKKKSPESDIEAATRLGNDAFWLTSHGLNSSGKALPARFIFFATSVPQLNQPVTVVGTPYVRLLDDLLASEALRPFDLAAAAERAPKEPGGFNIEGLTAMPKGEAVYIGFRNPIPQGRALLVTLLNPREVVNGTPAKLGPPKLLDLGGLGIRSLSLWRGRYLIAAGSYASAGASRLYAWDGESAPAPLPIDLNGFNAEAFFTPEERDDILLLSDDGSRLVDGVECKKLKASAQKTFRGRWLRPGAAR